MVVANKDEYAQMSLSASDDQLTEESPLFSKQSVSIIATNAAKRWITVEPVVFFAALSFGVFLTVAPQYIKQRLTDESNLTSSFDDYSDNDCSVVNISDSDYDIRQQIQADLSQWQLLLTIIPTFPALFLAPFLGSWGNEVGRKATLTISLTPYILYEAIYLLVVMFDLPLWVLLIGSFLSGIGGGSYLIQATCHAYIADVTTKEKRMFRIVVLQTAFVLGLGTGQIIFGFLIESIGFGIAFTLALICLILVQLYIFVPPFLIETIQPDTTLNSKWSYQPNKSIFEAVLKLFRVNTDGRRMKLVLLLLLSFSTELLTIVVLSLTITYGLGLPFCMSPTEVGWFSTTKLICSTVGMIVGSKLLGLCFSDVWIMHFGILFGIAASLLFALADTVQGLFLAAIVTSLRAVTQPISHLMLSKLVRPEEQGVMFACQSSASTLAALMSPIIFNSIYAATVATYPGFVFVVVAAANIFPMAVLVIFQIINRGDHIPELAVKAL